MSWRSFLYFTRQERVAIIVLMALLCIALLVSVVFPFGETDAVVSDETFDKECAAFMASLEDRERTSFTRPPHTLGRDFKPEVILSSFDPNVTDSVGLLRLGLPSWMAGNILRYRAKGGKFRKAEDFRKVYGLTDEQFSTLQPYLSIGDAFARKDTIRLLAPRLPVDSLRFFKYPAGTVVDLNQADTTELKKIPGIGSGIARMIVGYKKQLGGFCRIEQLGEIGLSVEKLHEWFSVSSGGVQRINLNKASIERINAHPYFNFYQAKLIVEYRQKKGALRSLQPMKLYEEFTPQDLERMEPYSCF